MYTPKFRIAVAAALFAGLCLAQEANVDIPFQKFVLNNGLTVIVHEDHKAPIVAVDVWYHVGSKNEKPGKTGFAHLFEHLMFGGSENVKTGYINAFERVGATNLNGTTSEDRTNYFETVPTTALDYALFLESDRMGHLLGSFDKKVLDTQRGVVQNEKRQDENQPYAVAEQLIVDATYPARHPYSWTVIGSMDDLNAASMADVTQWFKTYYGPSNAVIVLAGDIDLATAKQKMEKYFGDIPPGPPVAHQEVWIAKMTGTQRERVQDRVPLARVYKIWNIPQFGSADADYLDLVSDCLSQGRSSRLYKRLVYDSQIATNVRASVDLREIGGQFDIEATAKPGQDLKTIEAAIDEELARFIKDGPTPQELERVQTQYRARFIRGLERSGGFGGKADQLARGQVYLGDPASYKKSLNRVSQATAADLRDAARKWLSDGQFVLEVEPFPKLEPLSASVDRSKLPPVVPPADAKLPKLERATLPNGLKVILAERHDLPLVDFRMLVDAGYASDQFSKAGTASLAMTLLTDGTATRNALQISDESRSLGAQLNASSNLDSSMVNLSALKDKLDPSLALFADAVLNPAFPPSDFAREKRQMLARIEQEKATPVSMALRVLPELLYGKGNAYANPFTGSGTAASVSSIQRAELVKFHDTWFKPNNATLIVTGDTSLPEILPKLEKQFGAWKPGTVPKKNLERASLPQKSSVYLLDRPGALQSIIIAGEVSPPRNNPQELALGVLNDVIGGKFSSRLNMNLREDKHWSYGASSAFSAARGQRPFMAVAPVQTDKTKESLAEMNRELHAIAAAQPVTETELDNARRDRLLSLAGSRETLGSVTAAINEIVAFGLPDNYWDTYAARLRALNTAQIRDAASSVIHPDNLVWIVVGDRGTIEQGVRDLGLGEFHLIDADGNPLPDK